MRKNVLLLLLSILWCNVDAQDTLGQAMVPDSTLIKEMGEINHEQFKLPPLSVFLDAANSYSDIKYLEEKKTEGEQLLKISKKEWLKYIRLQGNYQYGTNSAYTLQTNELLPPTGAYSSLSTQSWYNAGVIVSIPLDDLFSRKNKNNVARSQIKQTEYETQKALEDRQLLILESYNEVLKHLTLLKVRAEAMSLYNAQMKISERDFASGRIDIITLSLERGRRSAATVNYEESKAALYNAVTKLEMLTKVKITTE